MTKIQKILILGADGFIGSNLAKSLKKEKKYFLRAFDLFKDGVSRNLDGFFDDNLEMFPGNFLNKDDLRKALEGIDYVFHFISLTTPGSSMNDPLIDVNANIAGTLSLLDECVKAKVKRVIFSSSGGAIYGNQNKEKYVEDDNTDPISPYAISKLTIEKYLKYYKLQWGLDYLVLRYSNPYGPGQNVVGSQGIIPIFLNLAKQNQPITIFGDGENIRDYIYIDGLINMTKLIFTQKTKHNVYNIGSGEGRSINEVVFFLEKALGKKIKINKLPARGIDVRRVVLDVGRFREEFGCQKEIPIKEGIKKTWNELNKN